LAGAKSQKVLVHAGIQSVAQGAVIVVLESDEAEGLQNSVFGFARRLQDLRHASHRARFHLEGDLDQIALLQGPSQSQHATGLGNSLQFGSCAPPVTQLDDDRDGAAKLDSLRAMLRMSLGEVCHRITMAPEATPRQITEGQSQGPLFPANEGKTAGRREPLSNQRNLSRPSSLLRACKIYWWGFCTCVVRGHVRGNPLRTGHWVASQFAAIIVQLNHSSYLYA